jgi:hypothetical protein
LVTGSLGHFLNGDLAVNPLFGVFQCLLAKLSTLEGEFTEQEFPFIIIITDSIILI